MRRGGRGIGLGCVPGRSRPEVPCRVGRPSETLCPSTVPSTLRRARVPLRLVPLGTRVAGYPARVFRKMCEMCALFVWP